MQTTPWLNNPIDVAYLAVPGMRKPAIFSAALFSPAIGVPSGGVYGEVKLKTSVDGVNWPDDVDATDFASTTIPLPVSQIVLDMGSGEQVYPVRQIPRLSAVLFFPDIALVFWGNFSFGFVKVSGHATP